MNTCILLLLLVDQITSDSANLYILHANRKVACMLVNRMLAKSQASWQNCGLACSQECVIAESHHIMNMHDQFMGVNTI